MVEIKQVYQFIKQNLYLISLGVLAISLPVSEFGMSISIFGLALAWLINGPKKEQWRLYMHHTTALLVTAIFLIDILGLVHTQDYHYALGVLRIKLPLLLVPLFVAPLRLKKQTWLILIGLFAASTFTATLICYINYQINLKDNLYNIREVSIFISHIRFGLMINMALVVFVYFFFKWASDLKYLLLIPVFWMVYFLVFLGSGNGYLVLFYLLLVGLIGFVTQPKFKFIGLALSLFALGVVGYTFFIGRVSYQSYLKKKDVTYNQQPTDNKRNDRGRLLSSSPKNQQLQNGFLVWRNICYAELKKEWKTRADSTYHLTDAKEQNIIGTLILYLTSEGWPKDSTGVWQLSEQDLENIYLGKTDYRMKHWNNYRKKIDGYLFQYSTYLQGKNPGNKSLVQRLEYLKGARQIIDSNWLWGVGTGDVQQAFNRYYQTQDIELADSFKARSHNQYLTYFVGQGIFGFVAFLFIVFYLLIVFYKRNKLFGLVYGIMLISFLSEDTLETQPGVTLYVFIGAMGILLLNALKPTRQTSSP